MVSDLQAGILPLRYVAGFFTDEMLVTRVHWDEWKSVSECEEYKHLDRRPTDQAFLMMYNTDYQVSQFLAVGGRGDGRDNTLYCSLSQ
jgi:hypothetical protein